MDDLIERLDAALALDAQTATDAEWTELLAQAENARDRIAALEAELDIAQDYKDCGCSYDHPNDLCLGHEKLFKRLTDKRIATLEALVKEAGEALDDALGHIIYLCESEGDYQHDWRTEKTRTTLARIKENSRDT